MRLLKYFLIVFISVSICSCGNTLQSYINSTNVDYKYKAAMNYFKQKKYDKAAQVFQSLIFLTTNLSKDDTVRYYTALSYYKSGDYYSAQDYFDKFLQAYPASPFSANARFLNINCLYDQCLRYELDPRPTYKAINAINDFYRDFPQESVKYRDICNKYLINLQDRLYKKSYMAALLYYNMDDYKSAIVAFKNVVREEPDNIYREQLLYYTALSSYKYAYNSIRSKQKERYLNFVDDYLNFIGEYPKSKYVKDLEPYYEDVQKYLEDHSGKKK